MSPTSWRSRPARAGDTFPALKVEAQATIAEFDAQHPDGADYVIVPAMSRDDDPAVLHWIKSQAAKGATIVGVCAGAKVVAAAGLLDGKRATTHWYSLDELRSSTRAIRYVADRRIVVDHGVATTTGITASMPMSLTLIEAIAGREKAEAVARDLGLDRMGCAPRQRRVHVHAAVRADGDRQRARLLEPRGARHRAVPASTKFRSRSSPMPGRAPIARARSPSPPTPARSRPATACASCRIGSPRAGPLNSSRGRDVRRHKPWTKPFAHRSALRQAALPMSSPCSSNIPGKGALNGTIRIPRSRASAHCPDRSAAWPRLSCGHCDPKCCFQSSDDIGNALTGYRTPPALRMRSYSARFCATNCSIFFRTDRSGDTDDVEREGDVVLGHPHQRRAERARLHGIRR